MTAPPAEPRIYFKEAPAFTPPPFQPLLGPWPAAVYRPLAVVVRELCAAEGREAA